MDRKKNWDAPPFVASLLVALVAIVFAPAFTSTASPPGVQIVNNEYVPPAPNTGQQFIDNVSADNILVPGATANVESFNTATVNATVEPNTLVAVYANSGTVNVNDSSPPGQNAVAQNIVVSPTSAAQTFREAHSDAICHNIAGQILLTATSLVRGVEYNLLC